MATANTLYVSEFKSPLGIITLMATDNGICLVKYGYADGYIEEMEKKTACIKSNQENSHIRTAAIQLEEYFNKKRNTFHLSYDLYGTDFQKRVWAALQNIPYGEVRTYKDIASEAQSPKAVRAVGLANNKNPISICIPCHRVIGSNGKLVGYGGGLDKKAFLLRLEGRINI